MRYRKTISNRLEKLERVREWLRPRLVVAGVDQASVRSIELATTEALANIMKHAYAGSDASVINITLTVDPALVRVAIRDFAEPFQPDPAKETLAPEPSPSGGLGMYIMRQAMDHVAYEQRSPTGTTLIMEHHRRPSTNAPDVQPDAR